MEAIMSEKKEKSVMEYVATKKAPAAIGPYSQAVIAHGFLFASGQIPIVPETGAVVAGGIAEQTEQVCKNIGKLLKKAGIDYEHVIKTTCFLADMDDFAAFNSVYAKYFTSKPARSCVAVKQIPKGVLCEIEVTCTMK
jgi:2-iminobutanoate/2-iminopropanoate deaminase